MNDSTSDRTVRVSVPAGTVGGVSPAAVDKVTAMVQAGRRYFGSAGAAMTKATFDTDWAKAHHVKHSDAEAQLDGERDGTAVLRRWMDDKPGVVLLDSLHVPGLGDFVAPAPGVEDPPPFPQPGDTDHIMVVGSEVILVDWAVWGKKPSVSIDEGGSVRRAGKPFHGSHPVMAEAVDRWLNYLAETACITALVCVAGEESKVLRNKAWYSQMFRVVEQSRLVEFLDEKWSLIDPSDVGRIDVELLSQLVVRCMKPYDPRSRAFNMEALGRFRHGAH